MYANVPSNTSGGPETGLARDKSVEIPKSMILRSSVAGFHTMFDGLMSLWMTFAE